MMQWFKIDSRMSLNRRKYRRTISQCAQTTSIYNIHGCYLNFGACLGVKTSEIKTELVFFLFRTTPSKHSYHIFSSFVIKYTSVIEELNEELGYLKFSYHSTSNILRNRSLYLSGP